MEMLIWRFMEKNLEVAVVILVVLAARLILQRFPKKYSYALWSIVGIRMAVKLPIPSPLSVFNLFGFMASGSGMKAAAGGPVSAMIDPAETAHMAATVQTATTQTAMAQTAATQTAMAQTAAQAVGLAENADAAVQTTGAMMPEALQYGGLVLGILAVIYFIGAYVILMLGEISYLRLKDRTGQAVRLRDNIWECDRISTPFVLGLFPPKIYIPFRMDKNSQVYVLEHERYHIRRGDPWVRLIAYLLLAIYWVNPLVWVAYLAFVRDQEMRCDEAVLGMFGSGSRKTYSELLLNFATEQKTMGFSPIAFGESEVSHRIRNVLRYKKQGWGAAVLGVVLITGIAVSCLTNQEQNGWREKPDDAEMRSDEIQSGQATAELPGSGETVNDKGRAPAVQAKLEKLADLNAEVSRKNAAREAYLKERQEAWTRETGGFEGWAQAMAGRDAETILRLSTQEVQQKMQEEGILIPYGGTAFIREWGAWTALDEDAWRIYRSVWNGGGSPQNEPRFGSAIIYYAIPTNENRLIRCRETIKVRKNWPEEDPFMEVYDEEMVCFEEIADYESFLAAYPDFGAEGAFAYLHDGFGALMNWEAQKEPEKNQALFEPAAAVVHFLNLTTDENQVSVRNLNYQRNDTAGESAVVEITFVGTDKKVKVFLSKPWGEKGIWAPDFWMSDF